MAHLVAGHLVVAHLVVAHLVVAHLRVASSGDLIEGRRVGVTLFLGDAFELRLSVNGLLSQGDNR